MLDSKHDQHDRVENPAHTGKPGTGKPARNHKGTPGKHQLLQSVIPCPDLAAIRIDQQLIRHITKKEQGKEQATKEQHADPDPSINKKGGGRSDEDNTEKPGQQNMSWYGRR